MSALPSLIIVGAGDFGREVLAAVQENPALGQNWQLGGFLDDNVEAAAERLQAYRIELPVLSTIRDHLPQPEYVYICAIASTATKLKVCERLLQMGAAFINLIHPTAQVGPRCRMGVGNILMFQAGLTVDATIGSFVTLNRFSSIGHDAEVGDGCTLSSYCDVTGHARLGRGVFMGSHASVLPGSKMGDFSTVGAGSIVIRRVGEGKTVLGVPARNLDLP